MESSTGSLGSESSARSRKRRPGSENERSEVEVGEKVTRGGLIPRDLSPRVGLGRKWVGSRIKVKVIGREVEKELGRWHWMGCPHGTEITKMGA